MINILYYGLGSNAGGIEGYLYKISRNIDKSKFCLSFIDETGGNACYRKELETLGARFFDITPRHKSIMKNQKDLFELFSENHFDILHFNCNTLSYITPIHVAMQHGVKIVLHSRNSKCVYNIVTFTLHHVNKVILNDKKIERIAVSEKAGNWLFGRKEFRVINNGIEVSRFRYSEEIRKSKRLELGIDGCNVYGHVGAMLGAKNHMFLIDVFKEIYRRDESSRLLLVGDGALRHKIEEKIKSENLDGVAILLGIRDDIPELLMSMDCMIFPSLFEGFPNIVLEAQTTGLPVLMSDVITDEIIITDRCKVCSLNCGVDQWSTEAEHMLLLSKDDRGGYCHVIEKAGLSVQDEIGKIQELYDLIV